jgi:hypothetical protein
MRLMATMLLLLLLGAAIEFTPDPVGDVTTQDGGESYPMPTPTP